MELIEIDPNWDEDELRIEFTLTNWCNFKCWYCFPGANTNTHRWGDYDLIVTNFTHVINEYKKLGKKRIYMHIVGGEPTLWPKLGDFAKQMTELGCILTMSTNGSRTIRWWEENSKYFKRVMLSCHHGEMDVEHIIKVGDILYESKSIVDAHVLMDPNCWEKCVEIVDRLKTSKHQWGILAKEVIHDSITYSPEQVKYIGKNMKRMPDLDWFYKNAKHHITKVELLYDNGVRERVSANHLRLHKMNTFKDWECNVGVDNILVTREGNITVNCHIKLYDIDYYYNLYDIELPKKFQINPKPVKCVFDFCNCEAEINTKKKKVIPILST